MRAKHITNLFTIISVFFISCFTSYSLYAQHSASHEAAQPHEEQHAFDPAEMIMEHIMDAHEFHFLSYTDKQNQTHEVSIALPVIVYSPEKGWDAFCFSKLKNGNIYNGYKAEEGKIIAVKEDGTKDEAITVYDFSLTRNVVQMFISLILLSWLLISSAKYYKQNSASAPPKGWANAIEAVVVFIREQVAKPNLGTAYNKYMPYLLTVFFFILINNLLGLIPGSANVSGNIAFTLVLAVVSFLAILFSSNKHYWGHIFWPPGVPLPIKFILIPVELLSLFIKPAALMIRLFANMVAGHIVITCFILLIFIFGAMNEIAGWGFAPVSIAFTIFIYLIEFLVAFIQAFIFTTLTAVFIGQAFEGAHHTEEEAVII